jgi:hypothetical protein
MGTKQTNSVINFPKQDAVLRRLYQPQLLFAPWVGKVETELVSNVDGSKRYEIISGSGSIVEHVSGFVGKGTDTVEIPLAMDLTEAPLYGNAFLPGTGEEQEIRVRECFINEISKVVNKKKGRLDALRTSVIERFRQSSEPSLRRFLKKWLNSEFIGAIYEGHSPNCTAGLNSSPDGIGCVKVMHPNMYVNKVDATTGGDIDAVGDEYKNKTTAQITAAAHTGYGDLEKVSARFFEEMAIVLKRLNIQKAAKFKGVKKWLAMIDTAMLNTLQNDAKYKNLIEQVFMGSEYKNPMFEQEVFAVNQFLLLVDDTAARAWNNTTLDFKGTNDYVGAPTFTSGKDNGVVTVLGSGALGFAEPLPLETAIEQSNFNKFIELAASMIVGVSRGEYPALANKNDYFAKGKAVDTVLGTAFPVINQSSAMFIVKK